ncbi:MAG: yedF [Clostridia bacterium]|jgi:selenium metabolism protein YedF|nr:yedF [Clostridia bacterium]
MKTVIVINGETFGKGDDELGKKLLGAFLRKLWGGEELPEVIICYNAGVKLLAKGSLVLDALDGLSLKGVEIIACGTCIDHYDLRNSMEVGRISDMAEIVSIMMSSDKVITV